MSISREKKGQLANNWGILSILMEKKMATHSSILPWEIPWKEDGDAIQPSHPLLSPSPPALNLPSIRFFSNESALRIR